MNARHYSWHGSCLLSTCYDRVFFPAFRLFLTLPEELRTEELWKDAYAGLGDAMEKSRYDMIYEGVGSKAFECYNNLPPARQADFLKAAITSGDSWAGSLRTYLWKTLLAGVAEVSQDYYDKELVDAAVQKLLQDGRKEASGFIRKLPPEKLSAECLQMWMEAEQLRRAGRMGDDRWRAEDGVLYASGDVSRKDIERWGVEEIELKIGKKTLTAAWPHGWLSSYLAARFVRKLLSEEGSAVLSWKILSKKSKRK